MASQTAVSTPRHRLAELFLVLLLLAVVSAVTLVILDERFTPTIFSFIDQITSSSTDQ